MGKIEFALEDILEGRIYEDARRLFTLSLGHENERRDSLAKSLGIHPDTFRKDLNGGITDRPTKTGRRLVKFIIDQFGRDNGAEMVIVPIGGTVTVTSGNAVVLSPEAPCPIWDRDGSTVISYAKEVIVLLSQFGKRASDQQVNALAVVGSLAIQIQMCFIRNRHREDISVLRLTRMASFLPMQSDAGLVTPLDRYFMRRIGEDEDFLASPEDVWTKETLAKRRVAKAKQLQRWRHGIGDGGRPPNDFICMKEYRTPCVRSDREQREQFGNVLALQTIFGWMRNKPQDVPFQIAIDFLEILLNIPDDRTISAST